MPASSRAKKISTSTLVILSCLESIRQTPHVVAVVFEEQGSLMTRKTRAEKQPIMPPDQERFIAFAGLVTSNDCPRYYLPNPFPIQRDSYRMSAPNDGARGLAPRRRALCRTHQSHDHADPQATVGLQPTESVLIRFWSASARRSR
jgi:hypothetical protein